MKKFNHHRIKATPQAAPPAVPLLPPMALISYWPATSLPAPLLLHSPSKLVTTAKPFRTTKPLGSTEPPSSTTVSTSKAAPFAKGSGPIHLHTVTSFFGTTGPAPKAFEATTSKKVQPQRTRKH